MSSTTTTRLGLTKPTPGTSEPVNVATQINAAYDKIDSVIGATLCTSTTRPASPFDGQLIRETDTRRMYIRNATAGTWDQLLIATANTTSGDSALTSTNRINWDNGSGTPDTNLYRGGASILKTDDQFQAASAVFGTGKLMTQMLTGAASATLTFTATMTDIPGATITFTTARGNALVFVTWTTDFQLVTAGTATGVAQYLVDGVATAQPQAIWTPSNAAAGARATIAQTDNLQIVAAGSHTIKIQGQIVGTGSIKSNPSHTKLTIMVFE